MTEDGAQTGFPVDGPAGAKSGWYRNKKTGKLRYWNGDTWTDISGAITPFTFEPPKPVPPAASEPPPPLPAPRKPIDKRRRLVVLSAAAIVVVLVIVGAVTLGNNKTVNLSTTPPAAPTPPLTFEPTTDPFAVTTTDPFAVTTTVSPGETAPTTTPPLTSGSGGSGVTSPPTATSAPTVAIFGDSITHNSMSELTRALRHYNLYVDAVSGTTMADHLARIQHVESAGQTPDWLIELGTNDAIRGNPNWGSDFANEVAALQSQPCVVLLTVNPRLGAIGAGINQAIASAVATHPNFHSLDWGDIELNKPQWLLSDGIHPTKSGSAELAKLDRKAILGCPGG